MGGKPKIIVATEIEVRRAAQLHHRALRRLKIQALPVETLLTMRFDTPGETLGKFNHSMRRGIVETRIGIFRRCIYLARLRTNTEPCKQRHILIRFRIGCGQ
jgi:hypothetical protein